MKYFCIDLACLPKISLMGTSFLTAPERHIRRYVNEQILYIIRRGSMTLSTNEGEVALSAGDVHLFSLGEYQYATKMNDCEFYYIHFSPDCVSTCEWRSEEFVSAVCERNRRYVNEDRFGFEIYSAIGAYLPQSMHIDDTAELERLIAFFKVHTMHSGYLPPLSRLRLATEVAGVLMFLEQIAYNSCVVGYKGKNGRPHESAERLLSFIETHFAENFTGKDIEQHLLINYDYANRIFKKYTGTSIMQYRNRLRINTAKPLLLHKTIEEVAELVGFENVYYFSRCFKRYEGVSPRDYAESINE